jgi:hypothetical protein
MTFSSLRNKLRLLSLISALMLFSLEMYCSQRPLLRKGDDDAQQREHHLLCQCQLALRFQESATTLIAPSGQCQAYLPYGEEGVLVQAINVDEATGLQAARFAPERYQEFSP